MLMIPRYTACLHRYENDAYNLPVDTIYFIESEWNYMLNDFVRSHQSAIEEYLFEHYHDFLFEYRFRYVSRADVKDIQELLNLHPEVEHIDDLEAKLRNIRHRYSYSEMQSIYRDQHDKKRESGDFRDCFLCHLLPDHSNAEAYDFYSIDVELTDEPLLLSVIDQYVRTIDDYNRAILLNRPLDIEPETRVKREAPFLGWEIQNNVIKPRRSNNIRFCLSRDPIGPQKPRYKEAGHEQESLRDYADRLIEYDRLRSEEEASRAEEVAPMLEIPDAEMSCSMSSESCEELTRPIPPLFPSREDAALYEKAMAIKKAIDELQRDNGLTILGEILGQNVISMLSQSPSPAISPLRIDEKYRILLPDYDREIALYSLPKALYFLFLRHPEGILREELDCYRDELRTIYLTISNRTDLEAINHSIDDLVEPGSDSLNQKISRINAAFRNNLADDIAQHYIIAGPRGEAKKIIIAPSAELPHELRF